MPPARPGHRLLRRLERIPDRGSGRRHLGVRWGAVDDGVMRIVDADGALPAFILAMALTGILG
jgi:hypothetical protein